MNLPLRFDMIPLLLTLLCLPDPGIIAETNGASAQETGSARSGADSTSTTAVWEMESPEFVLPERQADVPDPLNEKIKQFRAERQRLHDVLDERLRAIAQPTPEAIQDVKSQFRTEFAADIDAYRELGREIQEALATIGDDSVRAPRPNEPTVRRLHQEQEQVRAELRDSKIQLREDMKNASQEEKERLKAEFREERQQRLQELKEKRGEILEIIRDNLDSNLAPGDP